MLVLLFAPVVKAETFYVSQAGGAFSGGSACNGQTAQAVGFFNTSGNWANPKVSSKIGPGDIVYLCGTFSSSSNGSTMLTVQNNGSLGSVITVFFDTGASLTNSAYWGSSGAINFGNHSYVTLDGQGVGIIENTGNGSPGSYSNQGASNGINTGNVTGVTIQNLIVRNIYVYVTSTDHSANINSCGGISFNGSAVNVTVTKNTVHDAYGGIYFGGSVSDSSVVVSNNTIYNMNWGIVCGSGCAGNGYTLTGNDIHNPSFEDSTDSYHHNGIFFFPNNVSASGVVIANNYIHDINGHATAGLFLDPSGTGDVPSAQIYNNVFYTTPGQTGPANNFIEPGNKVTGALVYNNTMSGAVQTSMGVWNNGVMKNNIVRSTVYGIGLSSGTTGVTSDYNDVYKISGNFGNVGASIYATLAAWNSATGFDANSTTVEPSLDSSLMLTSGSPSAVHAGTNLTGLGITGLNTSAPGSFGVNYACGSGCVPRPAGGPWDMGAYEYNSGQVSTPTFSPVAGAYAVTQNVTISTSTGGATLCYTTDGSTPTANGAGTCTHGTTYSTPVAVASSLTIKAIASISGNSDSTVGSAAYTITTTGTGRTAAIFARNRIL